MILANIDFTKVEFGDLHEWLQAVKQRLSLTLDEHLARSVRRSHIFETTLATFARGNEHLVIVHGPWVLVVEKEIDLATFDPEDERLSGGRVFRIHRLQAPLQRTVGNVEKFEFSQEDIDWNHAHPSQTSRSLHWIVAEQAHKRDHAGGPIMTFRPSTLAQA